jgi:hypothetical protein
MDYNLTLFKETVLEIILVKSVSDRRNSNQASSYLASKPINENDNLNGGMSFNNNGELVLIEE